MAAEGIVVNSVATGTIDIGHQGTRVSDLFSLIKPEITFANLMAAAAGLWVGAHGRPDLWSAVFTLLGSALVVGGGAALNNFVDRDIDDKMQRTQNRPLVAGRLEPHVALRLGIGLSVSGLTVLLFLVNFTAAACAFAGLVVYSYFYTVWLKRTTSLNTVLGGISGALPPLIGYAGGNGGHLGWTAWSLFLIFLLWQPPHFFPLAMKRVEEYRAAGIPMLPVVRGFAVTKWHILFYTVLILPVSFLPYVLHAENLIYLVVSMVLGLGFLAKALQGLFAKDDVVWAKGMFSYSLIYLTTLCIAFVVGTL
ncbi:protoheme IX farnesyltransferase [Alicyclobacillaceae bacterium I2511]|nr:protoheme IX farnesyltransferase [Alicyclobacillaceae bacterium I2511]